MATAEKVVFKRGASSSLPDTKVPGSILVTTDTGYMYVDDTDSSRIQINAGTADKLKTSRSIDGVSFNGSTNITHYGTCSTAAATAAKVVALSGFTLVTGAKLVVKFSTTNTAANPTLNVNNTGAKSIMYRGSSVGAGYLATNRFYEFVYDGTNYQVIGDLDIDTKVTQSAAISTAGSYPVLLGYSTATTSVTNTVNKTSTLTYNPSTKVLSCGSIDATIDDGSLD